MYSQIKVELVTGHLYNLVKATLSLKILNVKCRLVVQN